MDFSDYKIKFKSLFNKLLHDKFELSADQTEKLLKYLDGSNDKCVAKILETPFFANLLLYALKKYDLASVSVKIFFLKLMRNVLSNEVLFNRFTQMQGVELLVLQSDVLRRAGPFEIAPCASTELYQAMVQMASATVTHYSGVKYIVESKVYQKSLTPDTYLKPPATAAAIYEVFAKLIWKLNEYEEEVALLEVLNYVVNPLSAWFSAKTSLKTESSEPSSKSVLSFVYELVYILGEVEHLVVPNNVVPMLTNVFSIETKLTKALRVSPDPVLARLLAEASVRYHFAASRQLALRCQDSESRINLEFQTACNSIISTLIQKQSYLTVLEFLSRCHAFWHRVQLIGPPLEFEKFSKKYILQHQFVLMLLIPVFEKQRVKRLVYDPLQIAAREIFQSDLAMTFPHDTISLCYEFRNLIIKSTGDNIMPACTFAMRELLRLKRLLSRQQACVVFQTLYYALCEFVLSDGSDLVLLTNPLGTPDDERYLALILDGIAMLLDEYEINWNESLEIVELQAALMNLIKQNILPVKSLVQTVDLITTSVCKLLSPELALLMESQRGGSLREVAGAARALQARQEPGARAAALRLTHSLIDVAYVKFMPLRAVISAHGLVKGAAGCALRDTDACAQATALRCLASAVGCDDLWTELLEHCRNLYEQLVSIMRHSAEGEVRKEAANVLTQVYKNRKVTDVFSRYVSKAMASAATEDPHWPVRLAALNYWSQHIRKNFHDRGMIDGKFPTVTFSKEKRKIIILNDKEIHKQIEISMGQLSTTGCLSVLLKCMDSSNHSEVKEQTYSLSKKLVDVLDYYKYSGIPSNTAPTVDMGPSTSQSSDNMLLDGNEVLMDIFECLGSGSSGIESQAMSSIEVIHPSTFLEMFRDMTKERPLKVDLLRLIDEIVTQ